MSYSSAQAFGQVRALQHLQGLICQQDLRPTCPDRGHGTHRHTGAPIQDLRVITEPQQRRLAILQLPQRHPRCCHRVMDDMTDVPSDPGALTPVQVEDAERPADLSKREEHLVKGC